MIILHLGWFKNRPLLWGESPFKENMAKKGKKKLHSPINPFDAGAGTIAILLNNLFENFKKKNTDLEEVNIWLPSSIKMPFPSSNLISETEISTDKAVLKPWVLKGIALEVDILIELLCSSLDRHIISQGVIVGKDITFWASAMRFAASLTARGQFLPSLNRRIENDRYTASWEPMIAGEDYTILETLSKLMPPVCRAMTSIDSVKPPENSAIKVLKEFTAFILDGMVRMGLSSCKAKQFDSVHDSWINALKSKDNIISADKSEPSKLFKDVREWSRPLSITCASTFRLCFKLEEPPFEKPGWCVNYLLQKRDDPSLFIPVKDVWKLKSEKAYILKIDKAVKEYLLFSLGQASVVCSEVEESLKMKEIWGYEVNSNGAHDFLANKASALEESGFVVLLPSWWTKKGTKQRLQIKANVKGNKLKGKGFLSINDIVDFDWELSIGDLKLTHEELTELARLKSPLVKIRGQWVQLTAEEIQAACEFWKQKKMTQVSVRDLVRMRLGGSEKVFGIEFGGINAKGWIDEFLRKIEGSAEYEILSPPKGFNGNLRPYQVRGYSWLSFLRNFNLGACLADDMGLGKTIQALALIQQDLELGNKLPVLLLCPTSVTGNWKKEASKFTPKLKVMVHHGQDRMKHKAFEKEAAKHAVVISSYSLLHRDIEHFEKVKWAGIILDEAQNIKNPETKQAKAARSLSAGYRIALTGTPVENHVGDLWSIMEFLNPGFLGNHSEFKRKFFIPIQAYRDKEAQERLKKITGPFILRRLKTDKSIISDLPEKMEMKVFCTLTKEQASLYSAVVNEAQSGIESSEGIERKGIVLATLSKLKQVCNHPAQFLGDNSEVSGRSGKLQRITEMLEEIIETKDRALIFTQFAEMGGIIKRYLEAVFGMETFFLHGGVPKKRRDYMVEKFQSDDGPPFFILSLKAGGTGINLTNANHVFHFDRWWNPSVENQATDRAYRIGQFKNVQVHKFICAGTIEEKIDEMIDAKKEISEKVIGTGEGWLTELDNKQLREIFALRDYETGE